MNQKVYVGIDLAKDSSRVAVVDKDGSKLTSPFSIKNTRDGMEKLLSKLNSYKNDEILCGMEASSNYWENVYSYLKEKKVSCLLINPYQVKKYRQALGLKIKTDSVDAETVAQLIRAKKYDNLYISDEVAVELKELVRIKFSFARRAKDLKKGVMSLLCLVFPEYTRIIPHPFSKVSTEILSKYPTSCHMAKASVSKLVKIFRRYQGCRFGADTAKELISAEKESFYWPRASRSRGMSISMQIEEISSLSKRMEEIEEEIKSILDPADPKGGPPSFGILNSIKGVGIGTISAFLGTVGDMSRFSNSDKLVSYIGFYPRIFESGKYKKKNPGIQKAGPRELRYMLYLSSVAAIKHNIYLKKYYNDLVSAGMPAKKALIKVAVKITRMMYSMLKYKTHYDPSRVFLQYRPEKIAA
ncbi:MAG: IS110 family transposase [Actinomycetia bacterium]|nr:IS110 family transposase [Actinomycetes bacterium]